MSRRSGGGPGQAETERSQSRHSARGVATAPDDDDEPQRGEPLAADPIDLPATIEGHDTRPAPQDPFELTGRLLERKYRVDRVVAEGGFGVVYAGQHLGLDRPIAIKVLRHSNRCDADAWSDTLAQFLLEARTLARLRSPRVVKVYDAGVLVNEANPAGVPWHVLEWIDGETLEDDLARRRGRGGRAAQDCMTLLRGVMEAIAEAHDNGIAHRDLKPSNIMLERSKGIVVPRVLDFGIAKIMAGDEVAATGRTATAARHEAFSPAYAAPEQVSGMRTGPWTDVHALGLLLTEVLTDRAPYPRGDANDLYRSVFDEARPTPAMHGVEVGAWEPVIGRALAIKPHERYATAGALLAALDSALGVADGAPPSGAPPSGAADRPAAVTTRSPRRGWAVVAILAVAVSAGVGLRGRAAPASRPTAAPPACTSNAACTVASGGKPSICRRDQGRCVALDSVDCTAHFDPAALDASDTVWLGTLFPTTGPLATSGVVNAQAVELARRDFAQITGGMSGPRGSTRAPSFGLITCDDTVDAGRAARHLVDVGVPAVIGFQSGVEIIELATSQFIPNQVLAISAISTNPLVTRIPHPPGTPRLVFRTTYNSLDTARAMTAFIHGGLEPQLRAPRGERAGARPLRVALLRQKNAAGAAFAKEIFGTLSFNGKSAFENAGNFREFTYGSEDVVPNDELTPLAAEIGEFLPQIILYFGTSAIIERVFVPLEASWSDAQAPRPRYVSASHFSPELLQFIGSNKDRRARVFGTMLVSATPENARFVMHYNETYADRTTLTDSPNTAYDAFYVLALAAYASAPPMSGVALSRAMTRLRGPGRRIEVGMTGIFDAFVALRDGENVDLTGSSGSLHLDPDTGEARLDLAILCASIDDRGRAAEGIESGLYYRTEHRELQGALRCP